MRKLSRECILSLMAFVSVFMSAAASEDAPYSITSFQEQAITLLKKTPGAPSSGIVLIEKGEIAWQGGVGVADRASGRAADADTHYRIGSITKMFVAMAVMQQVERGKLSLDASVAELAPELPLKNRWEETHPVRVVNLLEHTAGFDDMHYRNWLASSDRPLADVMQELDAELVSRWRPDQWHAYSNPGYAAAAYLVEKSSGMRFEDYVTKELLAPLAMKETYWSREQGGVSLALAYGNDGAPQPWLQLKLRAAGALLSTPRDMAKLAAFLLSRGATAPGVMSAASLERMERAETTASSRAGLAFAYGMGNYTRQVNNFAFHGHDGSLPGYLSTVLYSREQDAAMVVMLASDDYRAFAQLRRLAADYLLRNVEAQKEGVFDGGAVADPANDGYYYPANPQNSLWGGIARTMNGAKLTAQGDRYRFAPPIMPWAAIEYFPMPGGQIRDAEKAMATGVFVEDAEGRRAFTDIDTAYVRANWQSVALPQYAVVIAALLMLSTLLFAFVWVTRRMFGGLRDAPHLSARAWPLLATLAFIAMIAMATQIRLTDMLTPNLKTLLLCGLGWLFAALSATGLAQGLRTFRAQRNNVVALHSLLSSMAAFGLACWLWSIGVLGIQLWRW